MGTIAPPLMPRTARVPTPWPRPVKALLLGTLIVRSAGFVYPYLSFHLLHLGYSAAVTGQVLAAFGGGWLIGQLLCGWLTDRVGRRWTLVSAMLISAAVLPLLAEAETLPAVVCGTVIAGMAYDAPRPVLSAVITDMIADDSQRAAVTGWRHFTINVGSAMTGAAGGLLIGCTGMRLLFWANAVACGCFAVIAYRYLPPGAPCRVRPPSWGTSRAILVDTRLWLLALASTSALTSIAGMFSTLPLLMERDHLPASAYGWTQVANAIAVLAITPVVTPWLSRRVRAGRSLVGIFALSSLVLGLGMGAAGFVDTTVGYSLVVASAVPGEVGLFVAASDILTRSSPDHLRGTYAGIWGSTLAAAVIIAPLLAAWSLAQGGATLVAATTSGTGVLGAAVSLPLAALLNRPRATKSPTSTAPMTAA